MTEPSPVLLELLAEIPDFRQAQGRRHPLSAILALSVAAMLCDYRSSGAIAEWGCNYGAALLRALGFTHGAAPCAATLHTVLRGLDTEAVERLLATWAEGVVAASAAPLTTLEAIAIAQVRVGSIPQVMAALRNTALGLMRVAGETNIAAACRRFAAQPWAALALIGISPRTE